MELIPMISSSSKQTRLGIIEWSVNIYCTVDCGLSRQVEHRELRLGVRPDEYRLDRLRGADREHALDHERRQATQAARAIKHMIKIV